MLKRIHVDQHAIRENRKAGAVVRPPISVKTSRGNTKAVAVEILGLSRVVYSPDKPLSCGARLWIECDCPVLADGARID